MYFNQMVNIIMKIALVCYFHDLFTHDLWEIVSVDCGGL